MISHFSPIPYFLIMSAVFLAAWAISNRSEFYRLVTGGNADAVAPAESKGRYAALDGLRGLLAINVLFQHAVTNYAYFSTGVWQITDERFYRHLGGESVILFFMITGFLFWSKAIASKGRIDALSLYRSRFLRLAPMYLFSALIVTLIAFAQMRFSMISPAAFVRDMASWLSLGLITTTSVNGVSVIPINAGIHWTLHFEWIFYLILPAMALFLRNRISAFAIFPALAVAAFFLLPDWGYWILFLFGMAAAQIIALVPVSSPRAAWLRSPWASLIPVAGVVAVYALQHEPYSFFQYCITMAVFLTFVYGNTLCGLLRTRAMVFLGTISYSVYLMHGIVLYSVLHVANRFSKIALMGEAEFWVLILLSALLTVALSAYTYKHIEHEFLIKIKLSKKTRQRVGPDAERSI